MIEFHLPPMRPIGVLLPMWALEQCGADLKAMGLKVMASPNMPPYRVIVYCDVGTLVVKVFQDEDDGQVRVLDMLIGPQFEMQGVDSP